MSKSLVEGLKLVLKVPESQDQRLQAPGLGRAGLLVIRTGRCNPYMVWVGPNVAVVKRYATSSLIELIAKEDWARER
jgi:hypothetical protein